MTRDEIAVLLAKVVAYDGRTVGRSDVEAWHEALCDLDLHDAAAAVAGHFRHTHEWLTPDVVRQRAREIRDDRLRRSRTPAGPLALPGRFETDADRDARLARGLAAARAALPDRPVTDTIHGRAVARARAENGRPERPSPKPRQTAPKDWPPPLTDTAAALATRYLLDGHAPADVADRLAVSKRWCQKTLARFRRTPDPPSTDVASEPVGKHEDPSKEPHAAPAA